MGKQTGTTGRKRGRPRKGEQLPLIDVGPKNLKKIGPLVRKYSAIMHERVKLLESECKLKQQILNLVNKEHLSRLPDGSIRFTCDGTMIEIIPRDEVIRIKEHKTAKGNTKTSASMAATVAATEKEQ